MILARVSFLLLQCLLLVLPTSSAAESSPTTKSHSTYQSIRALDKDGQSVQLKHASQAASQQGTFILAVKHANNHTIHIISVASQPSYQRQRPLELVHRITPTTFLLCSGVQADARWLVETLRQMHKHMKLQYGSSGAKWAQRLASLYRAVFWGVPEEQGNHQKNNKWQHMQGLELKRWGRPLGVQSILIETNQLYALEPSGVIVEPDEDSEEENQIVAIGRYSQDILRQWRTSSSSTKAQESLLAEQLKVVCDGILPRGTVLSIVQLGTDTSWQMQL